MSSSLQQRISSLSARLKSLILSRLPTGKFARGVTLLAGGNAWGQLILLLASPILTRLYSPEDFGLLALYMAITGVLQVVLSLRYEMAINLTETVHEAIALLKLCLIFVVFFTLLTFVVVLLYSGSIATALGAPLLANYLWMLPISVLLIGCFNVFNYWCVRESAFGLIAQARLKQVLASLVVQLGGASFGPGALIGGQVANQAIGMSLLSKRATRLPEFRTVTLSDMRQALIRYRRFPIYSTWALLLNRASVQLPTFFFVALFSPVAAGLYALANRVLKAPAGVFISALNSVFLKSAATAHKEGNLRELTLETHKNLTLITLPPLLLLAIIAPELFRIVFGEQWSTAGEFARWMTILVFFSMVASPLTVLFSVYEKQSHDLVFQTILMVSRALALIYSAQIGDSVLAVMIFSIASGICYIGFLVWVGVQLGNGVVPMAIHTCQAIINSLLISSPLIIAFALELSMSFKSIGLALSMLAVGFYLLHFLKKVR